MQRRTLVSAIGGSVVMALSGCTSNSSQSQGTPDSSEDGGVSVDESPVFGRLWIDTMRNVEELGIELASHDVDPRSDVTVRAEDISAVLKSGKDNLYTGSGEQEPKQVSSVNNRYWLTNEDYGVWEVAVRGSAVIDGRSVVVVHGLDVRRDKEEGLQVEDVWTERYVEG